MKIKGLKIWQAILLVISVICVAGGGVLLYTYFTSGFGDKVVKPESIEFKLDSDEFNQSKNQFEIDNTLSLTINASNEGVTQNEITLSFDKTVSNEIVEYSERVTEDGVKMISNGVIWVPEKVKLGTPFNVTVETKPYQIDGETLEANVGGITRLCAKSTNIMDSKNAYVNIAVDVPVQNLDLSIKDSTTGRAYPIENGLSNILQNANFDINVEFLPAASRYRYSDDLYKQFNSLEEYAPAVKDYCFDITSGEDVMLNYNEGEVYFSATAKLVSGNNNIKVYAFKTAQKQEDFENTNPVGEGEVLYNAMLRYLTLSEDGVVTNEVSCSIIQATVGNFFVSNSTS